MYSIRIEHHGPVPGSLNLRQREWNALVREAWRQVGVMWHREIMRKHFSRQAYAEYDYAPRQGESGRPDPRGFRRSYTGQKLKMMGHTNPMVYTGESQRRAQSARIHAVATRNRSGVDVILNTPALNFGRGKRVDMPVEMKRFSPRDAIDCIRLHRRIMEAKLREIRNTTSTDH